MISKLLKKLQQLDIKISLDKDELCLDAPKGKLTGDIIAQVKQHKPEIINYLKNKGISQTISIDYLKSEAVLDPNINPQIADDFKLNTANNILLTGATGFIGAFILVELIQKTTATIYCLVRAENIVLARNKLQQSLDAYSLTAQINFNRIVIVTGDLSKPRLNLNSKTYAELAIKIDSIYHNGALVHHASPYNSLKPTNVLGTEEILRLACTKKLKSVHFISTISVFNLDSIENVTTILEKDNLEQYQLPLGGYSQSKWVAEKLVSIAGDRGLPVKIYRLGPVSGSSQTGVFNPNDFLYRLILGYVHSGSAPEGEMLLDILPVDYVSGAIAYLSRQPSCWGKAFHLIHPQPVSSNLLFDRLHVAGYKIKRVPYSQWYAHLIDIAKNNQKHILYPLVSLFSANNTNVAKNKSFKLKFDCYNTLVELANSSIICPPIDQNLIDIYLNYLIKESLI